MYKTPRFKVLELYLRHFLEKVFKDFLTSDVLGRLVAIHRNIQELSTEISQMIDFDVMGYSKLV